MTRTILPVLMGLLLLSACCAFAGEGGSAVARFEIREYRVEGSTILSPDELKSLLAPYTGREKDFGTVQEALETLEKAYRGRGFTTVQVVLPEQELENGVIRLNVIEYRIANILVNGNAFFDRENILRSLPGLKVGETPDISAVSRSLKVANENPAKKCNLQMKSGANESAVDAVVEVRDEKPWKVGLSVDNTGDAQTGRERLGVSLQHANLFNRDHLATFQYITSTEKPDKVNIFGVGYRAPFYTLGSSLELIGAYSDVNTGTVTAATANLQVSGKGTVVGLHYNQNLPRIGDYEHKAVLAVDYKAYQNKVTLEGSDLGNNVTVHPVSLTYAGVLNMNRGSGGFYLTVAHNLPGDWDGRGGESDFENARKGASGDYTVLRYGANVAYSIFGEWQFQARFNGQYSADLLVPGEQFGLGGANSVRGFHEREIADDKGYIGNIEIYTPDLCKALKIPYAQCRALTFYDIGHIYRNDPLPGEISSATISSAGFGLRLVGDRYFSLSTDFGVVIDPGGDRSRWSGLWHFAATVMY
jgi:hemolysin activation/secretion protein